MYRLSLILTTIIQSEIELILQIKKKTYLNKLKESIFHFDCK